MREFSGRWGMEVVNLRYTSITLGLLFNGGPPAIALSK